MFHEVAGGGYLWFKTTALVSEVEAMEFYGRLDIVIHISYIQDF